VADPHARVELTARFIERLESIEAFLTEAGEPQAYDTLLDGCAAPSFRTSAAFLASVDGIWTSRRSRLKR
jgi:hypothetical protein